MKYLILGLIFSGCATQANMNNFLQKTSAPETGCLPKDVKISQYTEENLVVSNWIAECKGVKSYCRRSPSGEYSSSTKCKELK